VVPRVLTVVVPAAALTAVGWWSGGYFPQSWGALLLAAAIGIAMVAILADRVEVGRSSAALVGALVLLVVWQVVTTAWAIAPDVPALEAERTLVYASAVFLALLAVQRARAPELVLSVLAGGGAVTIGGLCAHALGAGTPDDRFELPVGYPNASGILAAVTLVLGLGLATGARAPVRALAGGLVPSAAVALALSLSRGSILAATLGVVVLCLVGTGLRELATIALTLVAAALAVVVASLAGDLRDAGAAPREALTLAALAALSAAGAWIAAARRPAPTGRARDARTHPLLVGVCVLAGCALVAVAVYQVRESRSAPSALAGAPDRLLSTSTSSRGDYWDVAAHMVEAHPLGGEGAGGFTRVWLRDRPALLFVRDAHNLYLETLAELGPLGLALLLAALSTPLAGVRRVVSTTAGRAALATYAALLAHAALDWDWELPAVTGCTLLLGVSLLRLGAEERVRRLGRAGRGSLLATAIVLGAVALVVQAGNRATADANDLLDRGDAGAALDAAKRARSFRPWAAEPWELLGEAELALGRGRAARAHLRHALREDPRSWSAWLSLAVASTGNGRAVALDHARSLNPLAPEVQALAPVENP
jgi:tetratricopeptide (TPR) repeat protein